MKALKAFIKPFEALQRSVKLKFKLFFSLCPGSGWEELITVFKRNGCFRNRYGRIIVTKKNVKQVTSIVLVQEKKTYCIGTTKKLSEELSSGVSFTY